MVVGVARDPRLERGAVAGGCGFGQCERRAGAGDRRVLGGLLGSLVERRARLVEATGGDQRPREPADDLAMVGRHLDQLLKEIGRTLAIAIGQHLLGHREQQLDFGLLRLRLALDRELGQDLVERAGQLAFGARAGEVGDRLALEDRVDRRDLLDPELGGDHFLFVDVELDQLDALVRIIGGDLLEHRRELLARPAPFGPEIEQNQRVHAGARQRRGGTARPLRVRLRSNPRWPRHILHAVAVLPSYVGRRPRLPSPHVRGLPGQGPMLAAAALPGRTSGSLAERA